MIARDACGAGESDQYRESDDCRAGEVVNKSRDACAIKWDARCAGECDWCARGSVSGASVPSC